MRRLLNKASKLVIVVVGVVISSGTVSAKTRLHGNERAIPTTAEEETNTGAESVTGTVAGRVKGGEEVCPATKLDPGDERANNDRFGWSVSAAANYMIVGSKGDDNNGANGAGSAHIYQLDESGDWTYQTKLLPSDPIQFLYFGFRTAISGDTALVGTRDSKEVEVFVRDDMTNEWSHQAIFKGTDNSFGHGLDIDDQHIVVGEPGAPGSRGKVYVFPNTCGCAVLRESAASGSKGNEYSFTSASDCGCGETVQYQVLHPSDGQPDDGFGDSVAIQGNTIIVAAPGNGGNVDGAAYVFVNTDGVWEEQQKLEPAVGIWAYSSVALHGDVAVVGAPYANGKWNGAVYVFVLEEEVWRETSSVTAEEVGSRLEYFGMSISLNDGALVVGATMLNEGSDTYSNRAYVFEIDAQGKLTFVSELDAGEGVKDRIKTNVAISGTTVLVGAPYDDVDGADRAGAVYAFEDCV